MGTMAEDRLGADWRVGMRVLYWSTWQKRPLEGTITGRAWGRSQRLEAIYFLEIDAGFDGPREVVPWDHVTWPPEPSTASTATIDKEVRSIRVLGRHQGRVYVEDADALGRPTRMWIEEGALLESHEQVADAN